VSTTQTTTPNKRKVLVEMDEHAYQTLRTSAATNERTMSAHIRFLIRRELVTR
jgi:hypothetical protein